uniref:acyl-CoA thioesterase n=1 Tax=Fulvivirga sp. TaxID=1931237 RepID=UPI00404A4D12
MYQFDTQIRVRYADTDQMGYVYYGNYSRYYEIARVESLRNLGLTYRELEEMGVMMPVLENHSTYKAPALYDELLTVRTIVSEMPGVRIKFNYEITNESNKLIHLGETLLVFVDMKSGRPCRMPDHMAKALSPFFES